MMITIVPMHWGMIFALGLVGSMSGFGAAEAEKSETRPNVILIFADDLGPGLLGCYGQELIKTPHIDQLAREGIKFNNYYGGVFCAPARWTLLTGLHDGRLGGWKHNQAGLPIRRDRGDITEAEYRNRFVEHKANSHPIHPSELFLAQVAQQAGYATAQFGKLDRGFLTWAERVERMGWDFHEGYYDHQRAHGFYPPYLWRNGERFELEGNHDPNCGKMSERGRARRLRWSNLFAECIYRGDTRLYKEAYCFNAIRTKGQTVLSLSLYSVAPRAGRHSGTASRFRRCSRTFPGRKEICLDGQDA